MADPQNPLNNPQAAADVAAPSRVQSADAATAQNVDEFLSAIYAAEEPSDPGTDQPREVPTPQRDAPHEREQTPGMVPAPEHPGEPVRGPHPGDPPVPGHQEEQPDPKNPPAPAVPQPSPAAKFPYRGKEYTLQELQQQGLLQDALVKAQQYELALHQAQQHAQQQRQHEPQAPQVPQYTPEQLRHVYTPVIRQATQEGWVDEGFSDLYPNLTASMFQHRDMLHQLAQQMQQVAQYVGQSQQVQTREHTMKALDDVIGQVATRGDLYQALGQPEVREGFRQYLIDLNPQVGQITPDFLAKQYFAFHSQALQELRARMPHAAPQQTPGGRSAHSPQERGSARVSSPGPAHQEEWADMLAGVISAA